MRSVEGAGSIAIGAFGACAGASGWRASSSRSIGTPRASSRRGARATVRPHPSGAPSCRSRARARTLAPRVGNVRRRARAASAAPSGRARLASSSPSVVPARTVRPASTSTATSASEYTSVYASRRREPRVELLGRRVRRRKIRDLRERLRARPELEIVGHHLRDAEIEHLRARRAVALLREKNISRAEIAMNDAQRVRVRHRVEDGLEERRHFSERARRAVTRRRDRLRAIALRATRAPCTERARPSRARPWSRSRCSARCSSCPARGDRGCDSSSRKRLTNESTTTLPIIGVGGTDVSALARCTSGFAPICASAPVSFKHLIAMGSPRPTCVPR